MEGYKLECIRPHNYTPIKKLPKLHNLNKSKLLGRGLIISLFIGLLSISPSSPVVIYYDAPKPNLQIPTPVQTTIAVVTDITDDDYDGYYEDEPSHDIAANPPSDRPDISILKPNENATSVVALTIAPSSANGYEYYEGIYVKNGSGRKIDIESSLTKGTVFSDTPKILIIHTHSCESYTPDKYDSFIPSYSSSADAISSPTRTTL